MRLKTLAEIATIVALAIAALQYFKWEPNTLDVVLDEVKGIVSDDIGKISLKIDSTKYETSQSLAFTMYQAGLLNSYDSSKSESLKNAALAALDEGDYKLAIIAAKEIPYDSTKSETLEHIALEALKNRETMRFSVLAADIIPYSSTKNSVIEKITGVYKHIKNGGSLDTYTSVKDKPKTPLDEYKLVYRFANSGSYMDLDDKSAKEFVDNWFKARSYKDFKTFEVVFKFADSRSYMNMSEQDAATFAMGWVDKFNLGDFQVFQDAYKFAASSSFMNLDPEHALKFSFKKLDEYKKLTNNPTQIPKSPLHSKSVASE